MNCVSTYKVKIKHYNHIFQTTVTIYRNAVDYLIMVCIENWESICKISGSLHQQRFVEALIHRTKQNHSPVYAKLSTKECDKRIDRKGFFLQK